MPGDSRNPETTAAPRDEADNELEQAVMAALRDAVGEDLAGRLRVTVAERRVTLAGAVANATKASEVERAAAEPPGVLGVHSELVIGDTTPVEVVIPDDVRLPDADAAPATPSEGQINHKV